MGTPEGRTDAERLPIMQTRLDRHRISPPAPPTYGDTTLLDGHLMDAWPSLYPCKFS